LQTWTVYDVYTSYYAPPVRPYIAFGNQLIDPSNNFDGIKYIVPYTAEYTFSASVIISGNPLDSFYCMMVRSNGIGNEIDSYSDFIPVFPDLLTFTGVCFVTWTTVCNQGDQVTVNAFAIEGTGTGYPATIENTYTDPYTSITYYTQFDAIGTPFPSVLQPVDPNSIKRFVYSFDRPLRMQEIEAILDNTSRPIKFGQFDDPIRVIEGYINKVDIKSIIKQDASIQLKSNKILR
jgi:hypothetical protein